MNTYWTQLELKWLPQQLVFKNGDKMQPVRGIDLKICVAVAAINQHMLSVNRSHTNFVKNVATNSLETNVSRTSHELLNEI